MSEIETSLQNKLLTIDEAAKHFKVCRRTFSTIINNNQVRFLQIGRQKRFYLAELERCFEKVSGGERGQPIKHAPAKHKDASDFSEFYELLN